MAKLGHSTYTLTDLTETLPVSLVLKSNLDKNIQIKNGSRYEPDFKSKITQEEEFKGVVITPSLFLGQENLKIHENEKYVKPNDRKTGFLYYEIGSTTYKYGDSTSGIYVDIQGRLHIEQNLTENITIEAYIQNFIYESHNYEVELVQAINPINLLLLEENDNFYAVIECEGGREHFDDKNHYPIKMMACLYKGTSPINKKGEVFDTENYEYSWDRLGDSDTIADSDKPTLTVERKDILNRDLYTCIITDKNTDLTYTAQQFIYDFSDQYYCQLINNKPLLLSEANTEVKITANVWDQGEQIEDMTTEDGQKIYNLSYQWIAIDSSGQEIDLVGHEEGEDYGFTTEKTFVVKTSDAKIPKKDFFTIYCKVFNTDYSSTYPIAGNTISFQYIPIYSVRINPKDIFVDTSNSGVYLGNEEGIYTFEFQLLDKEGQVIDYDDTDTNIEKAPTGKNYSNIDGTEISFIQVDKKKWSFTGTIKLNPEHQKSLWSADESSRQYEFTYVYFGQQFTDEVNIIKNKNGENGDQGFSGYTIDLSNEFHAFAGGEGRADSDQEVSCFINAYFGSEKQSIDTIKIGDALIFERSAETGQNKITGEYDYKFGENNSHLFLSAKEKEEKAIEIIIRTNKSTVDREKALFLKDIEPLAFKIGIKDTKNTLLEFPKIFNYTINYNGKSYSLVPDANTIVYSQENLGTYEPSSFGVSATVREVNGSASTYSKGIIIYSFDSINWKYLGSSGTISNYRNLDNIYIRLYSSLAEDYITNSNINLSNAAPYLLDMETIPVVTSMDGYEIGGENLIKYSKLFLLNDENSNDKWFKSNTTMLSVLDDEEDSTEEKNLGFQVSGIGEAAENPWYNFKSPKFRLKREYIGKDFCFSCYVFLEKKTNENPITPLDENGFSFIVSAYDSYETTVRGAYQTFAKIYLDSPGSAITNETWETGKWIKIYKVFNLNDSFFTHTENGTNTPTKLEDCSYLNITFALTKNGYLKIKLPKLELGNVPSAWTPAPNDIFYSEVGNGSENILDLIANNSSGISDINTSFNITVTGSDGTPMVFTSYQQFVNYINGETNKVTTLANKNDATLAGVNTQIKEILSVNGDLVERTAYIATGYENEKEKKNPFLELGVKDPTNELKNHLRMKLTNTLLGFYENDSDDEPIAYFGGNALSITKGRFTKELYVGTDNNNYLVIKTTPNGVAFMWSEEKFDGGIG